VSARWRSSLVALLTAASAATQFSCRRNDVAQLTDGHDAAVAADVGALRNATRSFHVIDSAVVAGYARDVPNCLVHEHHGAMGYHHTNARLMDGQVEVAKPEILLYERLPDGEYRLNGVEYIVPYTASPRDSSPPFVMNQRMLQEDNLKFWYLHVWAWNRNPDGLFANFHPSIQCPATARRVFRPSGS
jgi:hypothetical protein